MDIVGELRRHAAAYGYNVVAFEKTVRLLGVMDALSSHPYLGDRFALKGGSEHPEKPDAASNATSPATSTDYSKTHQPHPYRTPASSVEPTSPHPQHRICTT